MLVLLIHSSHQDKIGSVTNMGDIKKKTIRMHSMASNIHLCVRSDKLHRLIN